MNTKHDTFVKGPKFELKCAEVYVIMDFQLYILYSYRARLAEVGFILGRALKEIRRKWSF